MIEIIGSQNIAVRVIADSIASTSNTRLTTFEISLPKVLLAEYNTHGMLSKNWQSSRAIPTASFEPIRYGKNQPGMSASTSNLDGDDLGKARQIWHDVIEYCKAAATSLTALGLHKQWANRCNDWHIMAKGVTSGTEWANFFHLRNHPDAQPEFRELARIMQLAQEQSQPQVLQPGQWHLPYVSTIVSSDGSVTYTTGDGDVLTEDNALKISAACCAQVSYRRLDDTLAAAKRIFSRLIESDPKHASPVEHQGKVMLNELSSGSTDEWEPGVTHMRRDGSLWSANFRGWIQARQLIANEAKW
jgi:hypothetical protein